MSTISPNDRVTAVRHFNRLYTRKIGVLREGLLHSPYTLTEARILFEIAHAENVTATALARLLGLDAGYLSRILARLEEQDLIQREPAAHDNRQRLLCLTSAGQEAFTLLDARSRDEVAEFLNALSEADQERLLNAMQTIESIVDTGLKFAEPFVLRPHQPGDMGWVTYRHGVLYAAEYGFDERFEALVAEIVAHFIQNFDAHRERCWIAEMDGAIVGSVFVVRHSDAVAKLRLLLVEPKARGLGLGKRLVEECIRFARRTGYEKITLWTQSNLVEARHIYRKAGFICVAEEPHHSFGQDLIAETWELPLK